MNLCPYCGDLARLEVSDVYLDTRELTLDACCEENLAGWIDSIRLFSRRERARWMFELTGLVVHDVLATDDTLSWTLDYGLELRAVPFSVAQEFIRDHHRHCDPPTGWKYGAALFNGAEMVGAVTAGRPSSRALDAQGCIEVTRVCVRDLRPHGLVKNACSILYGYACRKAFDRGYSRVVTYTKKSESGISLRAAGFTPMSESPGGSWSREGRPRGNGRNTGPKIRWERWKHIQLPIQQRLPYEQAVLLKRAA